jgi:glutamate synthase (NADPH/NADH) large chain
MLRKCHLNTCSVGIATQDPVLRQRFNGTPEQVVTFFLFVAEEVRRLMAGLGFRRFQEMVGRADRLRPRAGSRRHWKAARLDIAAMLAAPAAERPSCPGGGQRVPLDQHIDHELIRFAQDAIDGGPPVEMELPVRNTDRAVGAMLSGEVARQHGSRGLPDDTIRVRLTGSAGQSFGAFLAAGVTLELEGEANDYVGKGLSGGRVMVRPPAEASFAPEENVIVSGSRCGTAARAPSSRGSATTAANT